MLDDIICVLKRYRKDFATSLSINSSDTSISKSTQLDYAIPASKISSLSSGEFVGIVPDNPDQKIKLKVFHSEIQNDHEGISREEEAYQSIPIIRKVSEMDIQENYLKIKADIELIFKIELKKIDDRKPKVESEQEQKNNGGNSEGEEGVGNGRSVSM